MWALSLINGIIEDDRSRIRLLADLQKSRVPNKACDCINILMSVYMRNVNPEQRRIRDLAAHTLAQLISYRGYENHKEAAEQFLTQLLDAKDKPEKLSRQVYTHCFMYLLKLNELTAVFIRHNGFAALKSLLTSDCPHDAQIAYNVCCCFWILSYHKDALPHFQDFQLNVIEDIAKVLDFWTKEKIVRIICFIFKNLKDDEICMEHLSMINVLNLCIKLRNRPWVDTVITQELEQLCEYFDQNYQEFTSFDKWCAQVRRKNLSWSPVHTEKFWQTNFIFFDNAENIKHIDYLVQILQQEAPIGKQQTPQSLDTMKAIACYDLGEFARFYPRGKQILDAKDAKTYLASLMQAPGSSAELKKEAITAYQKLLMNAWGQSSS